MGNFRTNQKSRFHPNPFISIEPMVGIESTTYSLRGDVSAVIRGLGACWPSERQWKASLWILPAMPLAMRDRTPRPKVGRLRITIRTGTCSRPSTLTPILRATMALFCRQPESLKNVSPVCRPFPMRLGAFKGQLRGNKHLAKETSKSL
jgi:hypothetical protein